MTGGAIWPIFFFFTAPPPSRIAVFIHVFLPSRHDPQTNLAKCEQPLPLDPPSTTPAHSVTSPAKGFFLTTRMWPHFICMSPHQSGQHPSSRRSLALPDSRSHRSDKAQTRRPTNCLIGFSRRSFFDLVLGGRRASDLIDLRPHFLHSSVFIRRKRAAPWFNGFSLGNAQRIYQSNCHDFMRRS